MITTQQEARGKWCPFYQKYNRDDLAPSNPCRCLASDCMLWRWWGWWVPPGEKNKAHGIPDKDKLGYCGLSGRY